MSLTTGELAEQIRRRDVEAGVLVERIKHWTRLGLLHPIGGRHGGTGRHYRYDELALIDVAVLSALADAGVRIQGMELLYALARVNHEFTDWDAKGRQSPFFLRLDSIRGRPFSERAIEVYTGQMKMAPDAQVSIIINLNQALTRVPRDLVRKQEIADIEGRTEARETAPRKRRKGRRPR